MTWFIGSEEDYARRKRFVVQRDLARAQALVRQWTALYGDGCSMPEVRIGEEDAGGRHAGETAYYTPEKERITLPECPDMSALLHEFAHHLDHDPSCGSAEWREDETYQEHARRMHGPAFIEHLFRMAGLVYGDPRLYPWANEYEHIREWAEAQGLVNTEEPPE